MAISNASLSLAISNIYVSTGNTVISTMYFCNYGATAANLNVWVVPAANSVATTTNIVYNNLQLASGDTYVVDWEKLALANGDQIKANTGGSVTATVSYLGI